MPNAPDTRSKRLAALLITVACALAQACTAEAPPLLPQENAPADLQSIETLRTTFASAYTTSNAEAVGQLYTEDAVLQTNRMPTAVGREAIVEQLKQTFSQFRVRLDLSPDETHTFGDSGWERGRFFTTITPRAGGGPSRMEGRYLILLEKAGPGMWRISRDIDNTERP